MTSCKFTLCKQCTLQIHLNHSFRIVNCPMFIISNEYTWTRKHNPEESTVRLKHFYSKEVVPLCSVFLRNSFNTSTSSLSKNKHCFLYKVPPLLLLLKINFLNAVDIESARNYFDFFVEYFQW